MKYLQDAQEGNVSVDSAVAEKSRGELAAEKNDVEEDGGVIAEGVASEKDAGKSDEKIGGVYTIRPLHASERLDFSTSAVTSPLNLTPSQLRQKSQDEGWIGMRVDLWDEGAAADESLLVKVQYWWRKEVVEPGEEMEGDEQGKGWRQCLHDIVYLGPKDGTEGEEGLEVRE